LINHQHSVFDQSGYQVQYKFIEPHLLARYLGKRLSLLEIGSGSGELSIFIKKQLSDIKINAQIFAIELNQSLHQKLKDKGIKVVDPPPKLKTKFDLIILSHTLEHLFDPVAYLTKLTKLLKSHGVIYIDLFSIFNLHNDPGYKFNLQYFLPHFHLQTFNSLSLTNLCSLARLQPLVITEDIKALFYKPHKPFHLSDYSLKTNAQLVKNYLKQFQLRQDIWRS